MRSEMTGRRPTLVAAAGRGAAAAHEVGIEFGLGVAKGDPRALGGLEFALPLLVELRQHLRVNLVQRRVGFFESGGRLLVHLMLRLRVRACVRQAEGENE